MPKKELLKTKFPHAEEKPRGSLLSDIILGGQDGLVNVLGVILGVAAASSSIRIVLAGGLAAAIAESISMAAVAYTSNVAERDYYRSQVEREKREMRLVPDVEVEEIRQIYRAKGFKGKLLEDVVKVITSNDKVWLETMMVEELKLTAVDGERPLFAALIVGVSAIIGSVIPLAPFVFMPIQDGIIASLIISALTLFVLGAIKAKMTVGNWGKSGLEIAVIGIVSALAGYGIGMFFTV